MLDVVEVQMTGLDCKCDSKGKQINQQDGDWCWLEKNPCKLKTGEVTPSNWEWVRCEHNGTVQIDCPGNTVFVHFNHRIDIMVKM